MPQFTSFVNAFRVMYDDVRTDAVKNYSWGDVATYIPSLARANRNFAPATGNSRSLATSATNFRFKV